MHIKCHPERLGLLHDNIYNIQLDKNLSQIIGIGKKNFSAKIVEKKS
jgi:hypothetical protein